MKQVVYVYCNVKSPLLSSSSVLNAFANRREKCVLVFGILSKNNTHIDKYDNDNYCKNNTEIKVYLKWNIKPTTNAENQ